MALALRGEIRDQEGHDLSADDRHQDDQRAPGTGRREHVGLVVEREDAKERNVMNKSDEGAENDCAQAGHDADNDR